MPVSTPVEAKRKYYTVDEANKALSLVRAIVTDIVRQWQAVTDLRTRLSFLSRRDGKRPSGDPYSEEVAQSQAELAAEDEKLRSYLDELEGLGVEFKGPDGLCDFYSLKDGREIYLCWRLGEPQVTHWHEWNAGFAGRQPLATLKPAGRGGLRQVVRVIKERVEEGLKRTIGSGGGFRARIPSAALSSAILLSPEGDW